jgi:hypothetical protein
MVAVQHAQARTLEEVDMAMPPPVTDSVQMEPHSITPVLTHVEVNADPFHDRGMWVVLLAFALLAIASLGALVAAYYGDSVAVPSWNEYSVPAATLD